MTHGEKHQPQKIHVPHDWAIPNNPLPFLVYRGVVEAGECSAHWFERRFAANGWSGSWRNGVFPYHHYHSNAHEVLGVYAGSATIQIGGEEGPEVDVSAGDVVVIPCGGGHKRISQSAGFRVVGAYPGGGPFDTCYGRPEERPAADRRIASVPLPDSDPVYGREGPLPRLWREGHE